MQFLDDSLLPENQQPLVIQVAPYGPEWIPADSSDIPVSMDEQVQKAVDCYNAGATLLHIHVREADGKGSKRMSMFNELIDRLRDAALKALQQPAVRERLAAQGMEPGQPATSDELAKSLRAAYERQGSLLKSINFKPE